jgi:chorismate mutase
MQKFGNFLPLFALLIWAMGIANAEPGNSLQSLVETSAERLVIAEKVALAKWDSGAAVEDVSREAQIIQAEVKDGDAMGLDSTQVEGFFRAQFEELTKEYAESGLTILGLSLDIETNSATPEKIATTAKLLGVTYPILPSDKSIHTLYGPVHQLPETFYINRKGVIVEDVWGNANKETIEKYIREIVK